MTNTTTDHTDCLLSVDQTRTKLGNVSRTLIYERIKSGDLKPVKLGRLTRFKASDVARLIANGTAA